MLELLEAVGGSDLPVRVVSPDGDSLGPDDAATTLRIVSPDAIHRIITARGQQLGFARAIVAGDIEVEGDIFGLFDVHDRVAKPRFDLGVMRLAAHTLGLHGVRDVAKLRPLPPPPEEIILRGRRHSRQRDADAIASHYGVSNGFYRLLLGPSMTYSCAVFDSVDDSLEQAQFNKHELICRKLGLAPGMRLLDIGCGWGSMALHAAQNHGVSVVGVTISEDQHDLATKRVANAGLSDRVEIRLQDYRDVEDGPFDAISSVGMAEHVGGESQQRTYFGRVKRLLAPGGRFLNHAISRSPAHNPAAKGSFVQHFVFPDGKLHEIGRTVSLLQDAGFEARHVETFRLHYARTLRRWLANLEENWDAAVAEVGRGRALVWRIYIAGSAVSFERGVIGVHQTLCVREDQPGVLPLRPDW
ncbi:MAG: methyltransferase domain-containing protein [Acidimicrobiales bacterium]|nr:methyltransferase domain-containing protein [Acidimicrobiales bacterium]